MDDLNAKIIALADLDRVPMIESLIALDAKARESARKGKRARPGGVARTRADQAQADARRLVKIIQFLRMRSCPPNLAPEDACLCEDLASKLQRKGQWTGEYLL